MSHDYYVMIISLKWIIKSISVAVSVEQNFFTFWCATLITGGKSRTLQATRNQGRNILDTYNAGFQKQYANLVARCLRNGSPWL